MNPLKKNDPQKTFAICSFLILIISIIPLLYVARYNHPTGDDIYYGLQAHLAWKETGSLWQTILAAAKSSAHIYNIWQGTFSAMFIMHLQPTVFSENLYFLTTYIVLGSLLSGSAYLWKQITHFMLPVDKYEALTIWSVVMFLCIQWVLGVGDAFYWFNGAVYYSAFFGFMLWMFGLLCKYLFVGGVHRIVLSYLLAVLIGGSNYITLLLSLIILSFCILISFIKKHPGKWCLASVFMIILVCLGISALAPGNSIRQATATPLPAYKAIIFSLLKGIDLVLFWADGWWFAGLLLLTPCFVSIIRKTSYRFRYPLIIIGLLYGVFCSMICPTMYAQSNTGPARVVNLYRYGFVIFSFSAYFYGLGWFICKLKDNHKDNFFKYRKYNNLGIILVFITIAVQLIICINNNTLINISTIKAISDISSGRAAAYDAEYNERLNLLHDPEVTDIVFKPFVNRPYTVYVGDLGQDPTFETNICMAKWYNKTSVYVDWSNE